METKKMMKTAKVIDKILRVVRGIVSAGGIVCAVFLVLLPIFGEKILEVDGYLDLGNISVALADTSVIDMKTLTFSMMIALVSSLAVCIIVWYGITLLLRIFAPMKEGRPFEAGVSGQIRKLAGVMLVGGVISEVANQIALFAEMKSFDMTALFNPSVVNGCTYNSTFDGSFLIGAIVLFLLSHIFRYGEELQRESDETL